MSIQSPYAITLTVDGYAPIPLVTAGGWLAALPALEASQDLYEADGVDLGEAFFRPLGGVAVSITFTTEVDEEDLDAAQYAFLSADRSPPGPLLKLSGVLTMGGTTYPDAVVTVLTPDLPSGTAATVTRKYIIKTSLPS